MSISQIHLPPAEPGGVRSPSDPAAKPLSSPRQEARPAPPATSAAPGAADRATVQHAVHDLNRMTGAIAQDVRFSIDDDSGKLVVKVVDTKTQEVLRQIPSEEVLSLAHSLDKMRGLLLDDKA